MAPQVQGVIKANRRHRWGLMLDTSPEAREGVQRPGRFKMLNQLAVGEIEHGRPRAVL
jgi:hypothetical protein